MERVWAVLKRADLVRLPQKASELAKHPPSLSDVKKREKVLPSELILSEIKDRLRDYLDLEKQPLQLSGEDRAKTVGEGKNRLYVPLQYLVRGQDFISTANVHRKAEVIVESGGVTYENDHPIPAFADGLSTLDIDAQVVKTQVAKVPGEGSEEFRYIIIDGHHEAYAAVLTGSRKVPVEIISDYTLPKSDGSLWKMEEIWDDLKMKGQTLFDLPSARLAERPPGLKGMVDNPNRFLARVVSLRVLTENADDPSELLKVVKAQSRGVKEPLWIKINKGIPFIEFYIAQIFSEIPVTYDPEWGESKVPEEVVEKCRAALIEAQRKAQSRSAAELTARDKAILKLPLIHLKDEAREFAKKKKAVERRLQCPALFGVF